MRPKKSSFTLIGILAVLTIALILPTGASASGTARILYSFKDTPDGAAPYAGVILDSTGNLYGTTSQGGSAGMGTVFKVTRNSDGSWTESVLYSFAGGSDGDEPEAELVFDATGNLYGTTVDGGDVGCGGCGTVFQLTPNSDGTWKESVLHRFTAADGLHPFSRLIFDTAGNLYGTTVWGGDISCDQANRGCGTVFKLTPNGQGSWTESVIHKFEASDGYGPTAPVVFDGAGNLYGTTGQGGTRNQGTIFKLAPQSDGTWTASVLHSFTGRGDGQNPSGGLVFDGANLYGTNLQGGNTNNGVVFKVDTKGHLKVFPNHPGSDLRAGLIVGPGHTLYGNSVSTGPLDGGGGIIFKLTIQSGGVGTFTELHRFHGKPAMRPWGTLVRAKGGSLYGTTHACGKGEGCEGTVFEIKP